MKLLRYGEAGHEMPGVLDADGNVRSLAGIVDDIDGTALASLSSSTSSSADPFAPVLCLVDC